MSNTNHRPMDFSSVVGQEKSIRQLKIHLNAYEKRGGSFQHVLLSGPAGNGKTTLAEILARRLNLKFVRFIGANLTSVPDFRERLSGLLSNTVIFIDEIHSMGRRTQEIIYRLMEDGILEIEVEEFDGGKFKTEVHVDNVVVVGATTNAGQLTAAMRTRFGIDLVLSPYTPEQLLEIARFATKDTWTDSALQDVVRISRGVPRTIVNFIGLAEDYYLADDRNLEQLDSQVIADMREDRSLNPNGTTEQDWLYITALLQTFGNNPTGVDSIASVTGIDKETIVSVIEPYLIQLGYILRTQAGRVVNSEKLTLN